jgi:hypothetical protein
MIIRQGTRQVARIGECRMAMQSALTDCLQETLSALPVTVELGYGSRTCQGLAGGDRRMRYTRA